VNKGVILLIVLAAAICVPVVQLARLALRPTEIQSRRIDEIVKSQYSSPSLVRRLSAPERAQISGEVKSGFFTYAVKTQQGERTVRAEWRIDGDNIEVTSIRELE
jgi:hypothetical protein